MVPPASNLAVAEPILVPVPAPAAPARRDVSWQLTSLHERHASELLRFCRWMLRDPDDAADALQDTWMRAMSALAEDRVSVTAMRPWLYAIARNVCLDRLRDRKRTSNQELDEAALGDSPAADEVAGLRNEARAALALIGTLSERQRSALLMREVAGMSVPEIADALGVTVDRATWTIADARRAIEDSDGGALQCDVARDRLDRGARGRSLRAHLAACDDCRAHDRAMRAKRVLAPALIPLLWLRRGLAFLAPAASPAVVAVVATTVALPHVHHAVPAVPAVPRHAVAPAAVASATHVAAPPPAAGRMAPRATGRRVQFAAPRPAPAPGPKAYGLSFRPYGASSEPTAPQTAPAASHPLALVAHVEAPVRHVVATVVTPVLDTVQHITAAVPVAAPVADRATAVVRHVVAGL